MVHFLASDRCSHPNVYSAAAGNTSRFFYNGYSATTENPKRSCFGKQGDCAVMLRDKKLIGETPVEKRECLFLKKKRSLVILPQRLSAEEQNVFEEWTYLQPLLLILALLPRQL